MRFRHVTAGLGCDPFPGWELAHNGTDRGAAGSRPDLWAPNGHRNLPLPLNVPLDLRLAFLGLGHQEPDVPAPSDIDPTSRSVGSG
jgi:hypothetical protein